MLRAFIPKSNATRFEIANDNRIVCAIDDIGLFAQAFFRPLLLGDVTDETCKHRRFLRTDSGYRQFDRKLGAITPQGGKSDALAEHGSFTGRKVMLQTALMALAERRRD